MAKRKPVTPTRQGSRGTLHSHPRMEEKLAVPLGHVIIDKDVYDKLVQEHNPFLGGHGANKN